MGVEKARIIGSCVTCFLGEEIGKKIIDVCESYFEEANGNNKKVIIDFRFGNRYAVEVSHVKKIKQNHKIYFSGEMIKRVNKNEENGKKIHINSIVTSHYYEVCGTSRNAVAVLDVIDEEDGKEFLIKYVNPAYEDAKKIKLEKIYGKNIELSISADKRKETLEKLKICVQTKNILEYTMHSTQLGVIIIRLSPIIENNKVVRIIITSTNITSPYYEVCGTSRNAISILDVIDGKEFLIKYVNPVFEKIKNIKLEEIFGKSVEVVLPANKVKKYFERLNTCIKTRNILEYMVENEQLGFNIIRLCPIVENDKVVRFVNTSTDVTEQVMKQRELKAANERLQYYENILREQLSFEEMIAKSLRDFMDAGQKGFDAGIYNMIKELGAILQTDQVFVVKQGADSDLSFSKIQWARKDEWLFSRFFNNINSNNSNGLYDCIKDRLLIVNDIVNENKLDDCSLKQIFIEDGIKSILSTPIYRENEFWGLLCLTQIQKTRMWTTAEIGMIKIAAQTIMSAFQRTKLEKQLENSNNILIEYDNSLQELLAVEETIAKVSKQFVSGGIEGFEECANNMLKELGELVGIDRAGICLFLGNNDIIHKIYEWNGKGVMGSMDKSATRYHFPVTREWLEKHGLIAANDTAKDLQGYSEKFIDKVLDLGIKSILIVPITKANKVLGVLFIHKVVGYHKWTNADIKISKVFSEVFASAYIKKQDEAKLLEANKKLAMYEQKNKKSAELLRKIGICVKGFVDIGEDKYFAHAKTMCGEIAEFINLDKISFCKFTKDLKYNFLVFDWNAEMVDLYKSIDAINDVRDYPEYNREMKAGNVVQTIVDKQGIRVSDSIYKEYYLGRKIKSALGIPVVYNDMAWGFMHVGVKKEGYEWNDEEIEIYKYVAEICLRAYMRIFPNGFESEIGRITIKNGIPEWDTATDEELA